MGEVRVDLEKKSGILFLGFFKDSAIVLKNVTTVTTGVEVGQFSGSTYTVLVDGVVVYTSDDWAKAMGLKNEILRILSNYRQNVYG